MIGAVPVHVPVVDVRLPPTTTLPLTDGAAVFVGAFTAVTVTGTTALVADRPPGSVTSTRAWNVPPVV